VRAWFSTHIIVVYLSIAIIVRVSYLLEIKSRRLSGASGIAVLPLQPIFSHFVQSPAVVALTGWRCVTLRVPVHTASFRRFRRYCGTSCRHVARQSTHRSSPCNSEKKRNFINEVQNVYPVGEKQVVHESIKCVRVTRTTNW